MSFGSGKLKAHTIVMTYLHQQAGRRGGREARLMIYCRDIYQTAEERRSETAVAPPPALETLFS